MGITETWRIPRGSTVPSSHSRVDVALLKKITVNAGKIRGNPEETYIRVQVSDLGVYQALPPRQELLLLGVCPIKGGLLLDYVRIGGGVAPHQQVDWVAQLADEVFLEETQDIPC